MKRLLLLFLLLATSAFGSGVTSSGGSAFDCSTMSGDVTADVACAVAVVNDSHTHASSSLSGIDVSADTNFACNQGLALTGDTAGLIDCAANQILKRNAGDTDWECAADASGSATFSGAKVYKTNGSNQNVTQSLETVIVFQGESWDTDAYHTGSEGKLTVPSLGTCKYRISCVLRVDAATAYPKVTRLYKNGTVLLDMAISEEVEAIWWLKADTTEILSDNGGSANDYVECVHDQYSAGAKVVYGVVTATDTATSKFEIELIPGTCS